MVTDREGEGSIPLNTASGAMDDEDRALPALTVQVLPSSFLTLSSRRRGQETEGEEQPLEPSLLPLLPLSHQTLALAFSIDPSCQSGGNQGQSVQLLMKVEVEYMSDCQDWKDLMSPTRGTVESDAVVDKDKQEEHEEKDRKTGGKSSTYTRK